MGNLIPRQVMKNQRKDNGKNRLALKIPNSLKVKEISFVKFHNLEIDGNI